MIYEKLASFGDIFPNLKLRSPDADAGFGPCPVCVDPDNDDRFWFARGRNGFIYGHCRRCDPRGGDVIHWLMKLGLSRSDAERRAYAAPISTASKQRRITALPAVNVTRADLMHLAGAMYASLEPASVAFLKQRKITSAQIAQWKIGTTRTHRIAIPWLAKVNERLTCEHIQTRAVSASDEIRYSIMPGSTAVYPHGFGLNRNWNDAVDTAILCEGEFDFIAVMHVLDITHMRQHVAALTRGMAQARWKPSDLPPQTKRVICAYDNDEAGDAGAVQIQSDLSQLNHVRLTMPEGIKDVAQWASTSLTACLLAILQAVNE